LVANEKNEQLVLLLPA